MSSIRLLTIPAETVKKLAYISKNAGKLELRDSENFWMISEGSGGYDWSQTDVGVNNKGQFIVGYQSGCSCNGPEEPSVDGSYPLRGTIEFSPDSYYYDEIGDIVPDLSKLTDTLHDLLRGKKVPAQDIIGIANAEVRRAAINLVGFERFVKDVKSELVDEDPAHGKLLRVPLSDDEDLVLLLVKDASTPRKYFLRVPPNMKTAAQARAWTFGMEPEEFRPIQET